MQLIERHWTACEVFCHPSALLSRSGGHNRRTWEQRRPWSSVPVLRMMSGKPTVGSARLHLLCVPRDSDVKKGPSSRFAPANEHGQRNNLTFSSPGRVWSPPQTFTRVVPSPPCGQPGDIAVFRKPSVLLSHYFHCLQVTQNERFSSNGNVKISSHWLISGCYCWCSSSGIYFLTRTSFTVNVVWEGDISLCRIHLSDQIFGFLLWKFCVNVS
jgi:hypothetical protein